MTLITALSVALSFSLIEKTPVYHPVIVLLEIFTSNNNMNSFVDKIKGAYKLVLFKIYITKCVSVSLIILFHHLHDC